VAEREIPVRADQIRPGDRIWYAGVWREVRSTVTVTTVHTARVSLDYEARQELTVHRDVPAPLDGDDLPAPTLDSVLGWIATRINACRWPIEGGYPVRMQGIDDGTADLDLLPADFDPEEDWENPPKPVASYRITLTPAASEEQASE
jgi:hypothetical protein